MLYDYAAYINEHLFRHHNQISDQVEHRTYKIMSNQAFF